MELGPNASGVTTLFQERETQRVTVICRLPMGRGGMILCRNSAGESIVVYDKQIQLDMSVPARFKFSTFERFAPYIGRALEEFPKALRIDPKTLSVETFAGRMRDAIRAKEMFPMYAHPAIDEALFAKFAKDITISMKTDHILVGSSDSVRTATPNVATLSDASGLPGKAPNEVILDGSNHPNMESLCLLLHSRALNPCPEFIVRNLEEEFAKSLESRYDVAFVPIKNGEYRIL